ncbi:MAG: phage portal protein family protein, partial [Terriglobia bacterium]
VPGTPITGGFLLDLGEYNPELMGRNAIPSYEKMRRGDAQVRATLAACKLPVQSARWNVTSPSSAYGEAAKPAAVSSNGAGRNTAAKAREIREFVRENLFGGLESRTESGAWVTQSWDEVVRNALLMLDFGCAIHEDIWTVDGSRIRLRRLAPRLPVTFYRWLTEPDGETLVAVEQYGYRNDRFLTALLPAEKMARFTYQQEGANFWGISLLRAMYPHWYIKAALYKIDSIAAERNALGIPVFRLSPGFSSQDKEAAYNFVTQLAAHEATGMVEPPGDGTTGLRIVGYQGRLRDVMPSIQHHNVMISHAALVLFMDLGQAEHGSRSLGDSSQAFFMLSLQNVADQIALTITNSTVRRLVEFNFGENATIPRLVAANVQSRSLGDIASALTQFAQAGLVISESNLRRFIRDELALPEESPEGIAAIRGETIEVGDGGAEVGGRHGGLELPAR